jgi:hypothetical protein
MPLAVEHTADTRARAPGPPCSPLDSVSPHVLRIRATPRTPLANHSRPVRPSPSFPTSPERRHDHGTVKLTATVLLSPPLRVPDLRRAPPLPLRQRIEDGSHPVELDDPIFFLGPDELWRRFRLPRALPEHTATALQLPVSSLRLPLSSPRVFHRRSGRARGTQTRRCR